MMNVLKNMSMIMSYACDMFYVYLYLDSLCLNGAYENDVYNDVDDGPPME